MWAVKNKRKCGMDENGSLPHRVFPDGQLSRYGPIRQGLTSVIGLELDCNRTEELWEEYGHREWEPNFYFSFIWVSCVGLAPFRNKGIFFWLLSLVEPCHMECPGSHPNTEVKLCQVGFVVGWPWEKASIFVFAISFFPYIPITFYSLNRTRLNCCCE